MDMGKRLLAELAHRLVLVSPDRTIRVAIDGADGAGKTTFADELDSSVAALGRPVIRASVDDFHNPKAVRYQQGRHSPRGFFEDSYNYAALKGYLLDPLSPGGCKRYRRAFFDHVTDDTAPIVEAEALPFSVLLLDGIFLHRPELLGCWDVSIFLRTDLAVSAARRASRDGSSPDPAAPSNRRYVEGQRFYLQECQPEAKATIVIDYNDLSAPVCLKSKNWFRYLWEGTHLWPLPAGT
jgi:uridine kinase